jgi:hypothetical protein
VNGLRSISYFRRAAITSLAIVLTLGLAVGASQAAKAKKVKSEVEIAGHNFGNEPPFPYTFVGDVHSAKSKCERSRTVHLFETTDGGHELLGTLTTDRTGDWELILGSDPAGGDSFQADEDRKKLERNGRKLVCKADVSPTLTIPIL